ncbi:hypothetical protein GE061_019161 [Apolygus lucorum]|uniref:MADF domain-containing protein n=1 Tax=Apolygus lucorum TaxID=248454 RepID=A0A6A4JWY2_APOLU|nr:hypothetical protein GE061_019161 [Apolygus lucorum]
MDVHQLILTIQKRSCLWNVADKNHFNRDLMQKHWMEVAQEMDSTYDIVKKKWKGLKDVFRKELKKMNSSKVHSSWSHFGDMEFMKDQMSPRELPVPIETILKTEMIEETEDSVSYTPGFILRNSLLGIDPRSGDEQASTTDEEPTQPDSNTKSRGVKRRYTEDEMPSYSHSMPDDPHKDDDYNFLVSFLPYMKSMPPRKKLLYRMKLCQLLYETSYSDSPDN